MPGSILRLGRQVVVDSCAHLAARPAPRRGAVYDAGLLPMMLDCLALTLDGSEPPHARLWQFACELCVILDISLTPAAMAWVRAIQQVRGHFTRMCTFRPCLGEARLTIMMLQCVRRNTLYSVRAPLWHRDQHFSHGNWSPTPCDWSDEQGAVIQNAARQRNIIVQVRCVAC
jgi:hypothetical protein